LFALLTILVLTGGKNMKKVYVVRIVMQSDLTGLGLVGALVNKSPTTQVCSLIECLRYAGLLSVHTFDPEEKITFDIQPPHGVDSKKWAEMNAKRMQSFGYNAVCAPRTW
jgi:hypothetical protein